MTEPLRLTPLFQSLLEKTTESLGSTAPNPAVGAAAVNAQGELLVECFHAGAGTPHAEALVISECKTRGILDQVHTLLVTLEPCNHTGRTPPCTHAILDAGIKRVFYGTPDPNPKVAGGGADYLRAHGVAIELFPDGEIQARAKHLLHAFAHWSQTGIPWVTVKQAFDSQGSMIPPVGAKTFTSQSSLTLAHRLRKRADAILTGSGTILADLPEFTVRHVIDHPNRAAEKPREIAILDRRGRVKAEAPEWIQAMESKGFRVHFYRDVNEALTVLGKRGVLEVLVEAGPTLSSAVLASGLWNESITIHQGVGRSDRVETKFNTKT